MSLGAQLRQRFPELVFVDNYPLADKSYFKLGGPAELFCSVTDKSAAAELLTFCARENIPVTLLAGGSNVIIADEGLPGLTIHLGMRQLQILEDTAERLVLQAEAGIKTSALVARTAALQATGLEGFIGVPGELGGAIYNNAHYLGFLIGDYVTQVEVFDVKKGEFSYISRENCQFAYEQSIFQRHKELVIFSAFFELKKSQPEIIKAALQEAIGKREREQPLNLPSCGCVFQNPPNTSALRQLFPQFAAAEFVPAGFLIDQAGLKGRRRGDIQVSDKHAAFFVNLGQGKARQVQELITEVKQTVQAKFGVQLQEEVFYLPDLSKAVQPSTNN